jgi:hypothetical protein
MQTFRLVALAVCLALSACATTSFERTTAIQAGTEIGGSSIVVYSFLDVRKDFFGEQMLATMNNQLVDQFKQRGVAARLVVYQHPALEAPSQSLFLGVNRDLISVPLKDYLAAQRPEEVKNAEKFRLMVFPSMVTTTGANIDSQITWTLIEAATDKPVWTTKQNTSRTIWWKNDEAPQTRSKQFVDGVMGQMTSSGLFGAAARQQREMDEQAKAKKKGM